MSHRLTTCPVWGLPAGGLMTALPLLLLAVVEPALANKFETIGGGFSGSTGIKREWLQWLFLAGGLFGLVGAILAVVIPHKNALYLNYANWRASAIVLAVISVAFFTASALLL